ncbi:MAG: 3-sulfinopropanoyl-CoA desulfinase [Geminicoccaceae bacterium]
MVWLDAEKEALREQARKLAVERIAPRAAEIDRSESYPFDHLDHLREAGFLGITLPASLGGRGGDFLDCVLVIEELAKACGVTGRIAVETNMGAISAIMAYGSDAQRRMAAGLLLAGDKPAICITEPDAGSAASWMTTRADRKGNRFVLNGRKHWITGGGVSKLHLIFARTFDEKGEELGIAGFIALRGEDKGLVVGKREPTMGLRGIPETEILLDHLELDESRLVLPAEGYRAGFKRLMEAYNSQRTGAAAVALGIAQGALDHAVAFIRERRQFGRPIAEFQGLQWMVAEATTRLEGARTLIWKAASSAGREGRLFPDALMAAQAKLAAAEAAIAVTNDALQMLGAAGYSRNNPLERMVRDARMFAIGGGTKEVLKNLIAARTLGMPLPQTRDGWLDIEEREKAALAAE